MTNFSSPLRRRSFLAILSAAGFLVSSCAWTKGEPEISAQELAVRGVVAEKTQLMTQANALANSNSLFAPALKVVAQHNEIHIYALAKFMPTATPQNSFSPILDPGINLAELSAKCASFSDSHLELACSDLDTELSRTLALIAGSEITHHALLNGLAS